MISKSPQKITVSVKSCNTHKSPKFLKSNHQKKLSTSSGSPLSQRKRFGRSYSMRKFSQSPIKKIPNISYHQSLTSRENQKNLNVENPAFKILNQEELDSCNTDEELLNITHLSMTTFK